VGALASFFSYALGAVIVIPIFVGIFAAGLVLLGFCLRVILSVAGL